MLALQVFTVSANMGYWKSLNGQTTYDFCCKMHISSYWIKGLILIVKCIPKFILLDRSEFANILHAFLSHTFNELALF